MLGTLDDLTFSDFYARNSNAMLVVNSSAIISPAFFAGKHTSVMTDVECSAEDVVELSIDADVIRKKINACSSDLQTYEHERVWLAIFPTSKLQN